MDPSTHAHTPVPRDASSIAPDDQNAPPDALDAILRQIVDGYFVLTDGQGAVSKWSEPAELLFGREAGTVLGQSFFGTLVGEPVPATADAWRRFLEAGEAPSVPGRIDVSGVHTDGTAFPMEAVFVPVKLDEGFDFSLFLEDLGFELPMNLMLLRMRQQHPVVVRALRQALEPEPQPWEGWRTAGTLVIFRPLAPTPWVEFELAAREAARAEADAATEERLTSIDPGIQGDVNDLDDAAAVVARLLSAMERIDELERVARGLPGQLEEARQGAERRAEAAEREARALRDEMQRALTADDQRDLLARLDRLERARLDAEQASADRGREAAATRAELAAALRRVEDVQREAAARPAAADLAALRAQVDALAGADDSTRLERELLALREQVDANVGRLGQRVDALASSDDVAERLQAEIAGLRDRLDAAAADVARRDDLEGQQEQVRTWLDEARRERDDLRAATERAGAQVDELRRSLEEREPAVPAADTVERDVVDAISGDVEALRNAEQALRMRLADLESTGGATERRLDDLAERAGRDDDAHRRIDELAERAGRDDEARERLDTVDAAARRTEDRFTALAADQAEIRVRTEQAAGAAEQLAERLDEVDRGAGSVLADVQALNERADAVAAAGERSGARLDALDAHVEGLRGDMAAGRERLDALGSRVDRFGEEVSESERGTRAALEAQGAELRQELTAVRRVAEDARAGLDGLREELRGVADTGTRRVDAMQAELTSALASLDEVKAGLTSAGQAAVMARREAEQAKKAVGDSQSGVHDVFQQLLAAVRSGGQGATASAQAPRRGLSTPRPEAVEREPRPGFDDVAQPCALLGIDGVFRELNASFARLVGYQEHEFAKAAWPSPHDRASYQQQQEQLRQLVSGEIESVSVQSTYMHGQGLMVPVLGTIRAVRGEDGRPLHLLLEAEERAHG